MPRKNNKTPEVKVLLRENQRRARARQKELIEDMRQRLRTYENEGVQASLDMQSAARAVAAENRCLRTLLAQYGMSYEAVDEFLRNNGVGRTTIPAAGPPAMPQDTLREIPQDISQDRPKDAPRESPPGTFSPCTTTTPISPRDLSRAPSPGTLMDCDIAASIVADLHGHGDHNLARTTLGCSTGSCSVKTTQVFSIIDRAT
ncbi:hypothetical protein Sste5346_008098 [Sporothrix stenoceras]|uniref:Bzip transcription factor n=1 Tax=Sporothrix stenoceras TaxID=5173 RepID=A0ABR3YSD2_9PEZI